MTLLFFFFGLAALIVGAELLVRGASRLALSFGISPLVVGLTVVAFGTSSPELAVSVHSAWSGQVDIALGNVVGSNLFNVLFILGVSALIVPLVVDRQLIRQEVPVMVGVSLLLWALAADGGLSRWEGLLLTGLLAIYIAVVIRQSRRESAAAELAGEAPADAARPGWAAHASMQIVLIVAGLALLVLGSHWLVDAAVSFARHFGVSEVVIGLTLIAAGTSLPEVATSLLAAIRGQRDIAVGNVVGSNIFNILGVLGVSASLAPADLVVAPALLNFDIPFMVAVAVACLPIFYTGTCIARWEGGVFLGYYLIYTTWLVLNAAQHQALSPFGTAMTAFVMPLTVLTLGVLAWRHRRAGG